MNKKPFLLQILMFLVFSTYLSCNDNDPYERAYSLSGEQNYYGAIELLEKEIAAKDRKFDYYFIVGYNTYLANTITNRGEALSRFLIAQKYNDCDQQNLYMIGFCYKLIHEMDSAEQYFTKSAQYYHGLKEEMNPYSEIAEIYYIKKKYKEALDNIDKALLFEPDDSYLLLLKSFTYGKIGDNKRSIVSYQEALSKTHDEQTELYNLYWAHYLVEMKDFSEASVIFNQAISRNIRKNECMAELGYIAMMTGDDQQAEKQLLDAGKIDLSNELVLKYLTYYYYDKRDKAKTEALFGLYMMLADDLESITIKDVYHEVESRFADDQTFINLLKSRK